jgi:peroxiredoxin Q/BCP
MLGKPVADFSLPSTGGSTFRLSEQRRKTLVLCFYPQDNTPGCGCEIHGVSRHSLKTKFPFELLSDPEERACTQFGVMKDKNMYGKKVRGIERSTFVIDEKGKLAREWRGVKVPGHVEEVLSFVKAL